MWIDLNFVSKGFLFLQVRERDQETDERKHDYFEGFVVSLEITPVCSSCLRPILKRKRKEK